MDVQVIAGLLKQTLDPQMRPEAEASLDKMQKIIEFCPKLLQVIMSDGIEAPIRQAGAIFLKNMVFNHWADKQYDPREDGPVMPFSIHEQDRAEIRKVIVDAIVRSPDALRVQLAICISHIIRNDFPGRWPQVVDCINCYLQTPEISGWPGALISLYQLVKNYEYRKKEEREPLYDAMKLLLPQLGKVMDFVSVNSDTQIKDHIEIRKIVLKIFFALTQYTLPVEELLDNKTFEGWMNRLLFCLSTPVPDLSDVDVEERPQVIWWKEKKWVLHILSRIFERYGSPGKVLKEYVKFSEWYIKTFSAAVFSKLFEILALQAAGQYVSPRVIQMALKYINTGISHSLTWKLVKADVGKIITGVIFPLMCYTAEDAELWETDPLEYVRIKFDIFEDFVSPVTAAQALLHSICKLRKDALPQTMDFLLKVLQNPESSPSQRDGALHMIGSLADILSKKKIYKDKMEDFLVEICYPQFTSPHGHIRARVCWMLHYFSDLNFKNKNILKEAFRQVIHTLLNDTEVPVKVEAAFALQMLLTSQEDVAKPVLEPQIGQVVMELLNIIRCTENDELTTVMQKIVCTYTEQLVPMAVNIMTHIVKTFAQVIESGEAGDDKAIAAMGLLNTMETLISVMESRTEVHAALEPIVLDAIRHIFNNSVSEFYEEALTLSCDLTTRKISDDMWKMLEVIYDVFNRDGMDYFIDMMPLLHNYVTVDTKTFLSNPAYITCMYSIAKKLVLESDPGEDPQCHALKLLEVIILQCKGHDISEFVKSSVELALSRLQREILTSELRTMCIQVAVAALYYDPDFLFGVLQNGGNNVIQEFIEWWLRDTDCFLGLHDRKLCILGLCILLSRPGIPGVTENASKFLPALILLFDGLKRAYEAQVESDDESDSSDEGTIDSDVLESDEDEIDEESSMYLESLQKKVVESSNGEIQANIDAYSESNDSFFDETSLESYTTPIDLEETDVDEYEIFKRLMEDLEKGNPGWYGLLVQGLSEENRQALLDVITLCQKRKAAKESKSIEQAGGYNFQQQSVPNQFSFMPNASKITFGK